MAFDDLHSGAAHHHYAHKADIEITETTELIMMVLACSTLLLVVVAVGYLAKLEQAEMANKSR